MKKYILLPLLSFLVGPNLEAMAKQKEVFEQLRGRKLEEVRYPLTNEFVAVGVVDKKPVVVRFDKNNVIKKKIVLEPWPIHRYGPVTNVTELVVNLDNTLTIELESETGDYVIHEGLSIK